MVPGLLVWINHDKPTQKFGPPQKTMDLVTQSLITLCFQKYAQVKSAHLLKQAVKCAI